MIKPLNDFCKVELETDEFGFGGGTKDKAESGILVELPDKFNYFGFFSFSFENSLVDHKKLQELYDYYNKLIGQRIYWLALSEKGSILKQDNKIFALIKLTSIIAIDQDTDNIATNILDAQGGSFSA